MNVYDIYGPYTNLNARIKRKTYFHEKFEPGDHYGYEYFLTHSNEFLYFVENFMFKFVKIKKITLWLLSSIKSTTDTSELIIKILLNCQKVEIL